MKWTGYWSGKIEKAITLWWKLSLRNWWPGTPGLMGNSTRRQKLAGARAPAGGIYPFHLSIITLFSIKQRHCFQALPITSPELRVVHTGTGRSFSEASFQEHRDTVLWCYTLGWLLLRNLWGPVLQGESKGIQSARARAGSHGTHLTSSSHKKGTQRDNTKQERFLAVSLPSLKLYSWY